MSLTVVVMVILFADPQPRTYVKGAGISCSAVLKKLMAHDRWKVFNPVTFVGPSVSPDEAILYKVGNVISLLLGRRLST